MLGRTCWPIGHSFTSQTSLLDGSPQISPTSTTIVIMPRGGEILYATNQGRCSCRRSPYIHHWQTGQCNTMHRVGASISNCQMRRGGRELRNIFFSISHPTTSAHLVHFFAWLRIGEAISFKVAMLIRCRPRSKRVGRLGNKSCAKHLNS